MKYQILTETRPLTPVASSVATLPIGFLDGWVGGMSLEFEIGKTDAGSPAPNQDWLAKLFTNITLADGQRQYVNIGNPDIRTGYWAHRCATHGAFRMPDEETGSQTFRWLLRLIFSPVKMLNGEPNWTDPKVGIQPSAALNLSISTGAATLLGQAASTNTISMAASSPTPNVRVTYYLMIPEAGDPAPAYYPHFISTQFIPTSQSSQVNGANKQAIPNGQWIRRTTIVSVQGAAPYADFRTDDTAESAAVSEFALVTGDGRTPFWDKTWKLSQTTQRGFIVADDNTAVPGASAAYATATTKISYNPGVVQFDWARLLKTSDASLADPYFGMNLNGKQTTAAQVGMKVNATSNVSVQFLNEGYMKY